MPAPRGYWFDELADTIATSGRDQILAARSTIKKPLKRIVFAKDASETLLPQTLWLFSTDTEDHTARDHEFDLDWPDKSFVPSHVDYVDEQDKVLPALNKKLKTDLDWGERLSLLRLLLSFELTRALVDVQPALAKAGIPLAKTCKSYLMDPDGAEPLKHDRKSNEKFLGKQLASLPTAAAKKALAEAAYRSPAKRKWLASL